MSINYKYHFGTVEYDLASRTYIMGILNITPDSFSDGGKYYYPDDAIKRAEQMVEEGVDFIDIGGESTRPGSEPISVEEEIQRVVPVIKALTNRIKVPISIDTYKSQVAEAALDSGASIVNDISGMTFDQNMMHLVSKYNATVILMHIKGTPKNMQNNPEYKNLISEITEFLEGRANSAKQTGIRQIIIDPGIGFGKKFEHNIQIICNLKSFVSLGYPVLVGPSRKSFIGTILNLPPADRLEGTAAAVTASILNGANIVRVHDVKEMKRVALVADALKSNSCKIKESL